MRPTPVAHPPAGARYICPGHVGIVPSLSFSPPVPVCVAAGFSPPSFFPLSTANFRPLHPLSPLECADPQIAPITPLDCAVPKTKDLKSFGMLCSADHCSLTTAHFLLSDRATCPPCHVAVSSFAAAPPSSHRRRGQNSRP